MLLSGSLEDRDVVTLARRVETRAVALVRRCGDLVGYNSRRLYGQREARAVGECDGIEGHRLIPLTAVVAVTDH